MEFRCQHWSWGIALVLIMKYLLKKTIQNIFLENKCKMSEKQLEQLANLYAYNLKSQSLIGHFLLRLTKLVRLINNFMKMAEIEVAPYLHGRGFSGPTKT